MIELKEFVAKPCNSRTAFEFIPAKEYNIELEKTAKKLREKNVFVEIETPYLLMLKLENHDLTFFKSGKIVVKGTKEKKEATKIAQLLIEKINS
ncbi:MAG: hypothetical protein QXD98_00670 [Candidatus Diapherotrites archaeon]